MQSTRIIPLSISQASEAYGQVTLLHQGVKSRAARLDLIRQARRSIHIIMPLWYDDRTGNETVRELAEARQRNPNIDIKIIVDWVTPGGSKDFFGTKIYRDLKNTPGIEIRMWNHPSWVELFSVNILNYRTHEKMLIIDGHRLILGGMNIGDDYLEGGVTRTGWHDTDFQIEGEAAWEGNRIFAKIWTLAGVIGKPIDVLPVSWSDRVTIFQNLFYRDQELHHFKHFGIFDGTARFEYSKVLPSRVTDPFPLIGNSLVTLIYDNPLVDRSPQGPNRVVKIRRAVEYLLENTQQRAWFFIPYLTIRKPMRNALIRAAQRGIDVRIITNSLRSHDLGDTAYYGALSHYRPLIEAGVSIFEWQGHEDLWAIEKSTECQIKGRWPGHTLHTKGALFDHETVMAGSHNFNTRSEIYNSEIMAVVRDAGFASAWEQLFMESQDPSQRSDSMSCGDTPIEAPPTVLRVDTESLRRIERKHGAKILILKHLQGVM